jgi:hypothetical protein
VLAVEFYTIHTAELHIVSAQNGEKICHTLFVGLVSLLETFPAQCFGRLAAEFELREQSESVVQEKTSVR